MQGIESVLINATENKLKRKDKPKLLSDLERKKLRSGSQEKVAVKEISLSLFQCKVSSLYWLMSLRTNLNAKINQNYKVTLNVKSQGQGHTERLQLKRSDQGLYTWDV